MANRTYEIVTIGHLEICLPGDLTDFELERAMGESDDDFRQFRELYDLLFSAVRSRVNRSSINGY